MTDEKPKYTNKYINLDAEMALLGCLMFDETALTRLSFRLEANHFYEPLNGKIFDLIRQAEKEGSRADPILIRKYFENDANWVEYYNKFGGVKYLADLVDQAPPGWNINDYAKEILDNWKMRELSGTWTALNYVTDPTELIEELRRQLARVDSYEDEGDDFEDLQTIADRRIEQLSKLLAEGKTPGLMTGLKSIDRLGGLTPSTQWVIGGRPGMSKTLYLRNILHGAAMINPGHDFLFFSIEMSKEQSIDRSLSAATVEAGELMIPPTAYRSLKRPNEDNVRSIASVRGSLPKNVLISSRGRISMDDVRRGVSRLAAKRRRPIGAIGIDYFQLMSFAMERGESLTNAMGRATSEGKRIAKDFGCAVILLSQLGREVDKREDKRPLLSDLKDTSSLEQDADYVLFPFREYYYAQYEGKKKSDAEGEYEERLARLEHELVVITAKARDDFKKDVPQYIDAAHDLVRDL